MAGRIQYSQEATLNGDTNDENGGAHEFHIRTDISNISRILKVSVSANSLYLYLYEYLFVFVYVCEFVCISWDGFYLVLFFVCLLSALFSLFLSQSRDSMRENTQHK